MENSERQKNAHIHTLRQKQTNPINRLKKRRTKVISFDDDDDGDNS